MKRSCDGSGAPASLQLRVQSRVLSLLRNVLVLLCLAALAGLFLFPQLSISLGLGMLLGLGLWMGSYAPEALLLSALIGNFDQRGVYHATKQT